MYLIATVALGAYAIDGIGKNNKIFMWPALGLTVGVRFFDIFGSIEAAEKERYLNSRLLLNYTLPQEAVGRGIASDRLDGL